MKLGTVPVVIGNWKMNPQSVSLGVKLASELKKKISRKVTTNAEVVIAPPFVYLDVIKKLVGKKGSFALGAQNTYHEKLGAHTGEVSLSMLIDLGVTYIILGHSERRMLGETDEFINRKLIATLKAGLTGVICVGESKRDHGANYLSQIEMQIRKAFAQISRSKLDRIVVAYEPVWAIGTGMNASAQDIHEMKIFIEKVVSDIYGRNFAQKVRIIYGGSVNAKNALELHKEGRMDGFLVGGASLHPDEFVQIIKSVHAS